MNNYSNYQKGNPVVVEGIVSFITKIDYNGNEPLFFVFGSTNRPYRFDELTGITIDDMVRHTYEYLHYEWTDPNYPEIIVFNDTPRIIYDTDKNECYVDQQRIDGVCHLHEIFNIVKQLTGNQLPHYYPLGDISINDARPPFAIKEAHVINES